MPVLPVPQLLNQLALAGAEGLPARQDPEILRIIGLCRDWGFQLETRNERVYLPFDDDSMVPAWLEQETPRIAWDRLQVAGFFEIGSTNEEALDRARDGAPQGFLVYAEKQTAGRGRKGRRWLSPPRAGIYFTLVLRPAQPLNCWPLLTHVASVALVQTLNEIPEWEPSSRPLSLDLKWPNDVLLSGKKAAGILLETAWDHPLVAAVVGVGVNMGLDCGGMRDSVTSVNQQAGISIPRRRLLVRFLYYFQLNYDLFERGQHNEILDRWKRHSSMWQGIPVWIIESDRSRPAVTCGLSDLGALKIRTPEGNEETVLAADVSVRRA